MKSLLTIVALTTSALVAPIMAQAPQANTTKAQRTANDVSLEILNHVKSIFTATATATDQEKATAAATTVNAITDKVVALQSALKATPMPTIEQKKAFAQKMLQYEAQVSVVMKKMTNTFNTNSEEVNKIIQPPITNFKNKTTPVMTLINTYYPREEMQGYINTLKGK